MPSCWWRVWVGGRLLTGPQCTGEIRLTVGAAPEIAPVLRSTATDWARTAEVGGSCVAVDVTAQEPADVAGVVAREHGAGLVGLGEPNRSVQVPQVWVPDSSMWRLRLQAQAPNFQPADTTSIAASPVVLAMPQPIATGPAPAGTAVTWESVVRQMHTGTRLSAGTVDPDHHQVADHLSHPRGGGMRGRAEDPDTAAPRRRAPARQATRQPLGGNPSRERCFGVGHAAGLTQHVSDEVGAPDVSSTCGGTWFFLTYDHRGCETLVGYHSQGRSSWECMCHPSDRLTRTKAVGSTVS